MSGGWFGIYLEAWWMEGAMLLCLALYGLLWTFTRQLERQPQYVAYDLEDCRIVGLLGKKGSGKTTGAGLLKERYQRTHDVCEIAYGDALKDACAAILAVPRYKFDRCKGEMDPEYGQTYGRLLQVVGTDALRQHFNSKVWLIAAERQARRFASKDHLKPPMIVFSDVRFANEVEQLRRWGACLLQIRRDAPSNQADGRDAEHVSETELDEWSGDVIPNDASLCVLADRLEEGVERWFHHQDASRGQ